MRTSCLASAPKLPSVRRVAQSPQGKGLLTMEGAAAGGGARVGMLVRGMGWEGRRWSRMGTYPEMSNGSQTHSETKNVENVLA